MSYLYIWSVWNSLCSLRTNFPALPALILILFTFYYFHKHLIFSFKPYGYTVLNLNINLVFLFLLRTSPPKLIAPRPYYHYLVIFQLLVQNIWHFNTFLPKNIPLTIYKSLSLFSNSYQVWLWQIWYLVVGKFLQLLQRPIGTRD